MAETKKTPCVWAAELLERLEESGTPADKLKDVRDAMAARWAATAKLAPDDPGRHLSAAEALALLTARFGDDHGTPKKAREFIERGYLEPPKPPVHPAELIPAPPKDKAPVEAETAVSTDTPPRSIAGVTNLGTHDVPTVGPRPVPGAKNKGAKGKPDKGAKDKPKSGFKELVPATPPTPETTTTEPPAE